MKKLLITVSIILIILGVLYSLVVMPGCRMKVKHIKSSAVGLDRTATIYDYNGQVVKHYRGRIKIEEDSPFKTKFLVDYRSINVSGGITIIEEIDKNEQIPVIP